MASHTFLGAFATTLTILALPASSYACSYLLCDQAELFPSTDDEGEVAVPLDAPYVRLHRPGVEVEEPLVFTATRTRVGITGEDVTDPVDVRLVDGLVRLEGATEGDRWTVRGTLTCNGGAPSQELEATVRIGPRAPTPTALGALDVEPSLRGDVEVADVRGSCHSPIDAASATVDVVLDPSLEPYEPLIVWQTEVDGRPYTYRRSLTDQSRERRDVLLVAPCVDPGFEGPPDLEPGTHVVERLAWLPGATEPLRASAVVTLECAGPNPTSSSSGCAAGGTGAGGWLLAFATLRRRRR